MRRPEGSRSLDPDGETDQEQTPEVTDPQELFRVFYPQLAGWTRRLVGDTEVAHEIVSEAFIRLLPRWDDVREPRAWLYMTAGNLARDRWRKQSRERVAYRKVMAVREEITTGPDVATRVTVRGLVEALPERMRMPVLLHYYADLPIYEVAHLLDKAEGTIKRALFDARARMATHLEEAR
jgi:RNA polymerase sigma factor (sigma-70 family)